MGALFSNIHFTPLQISFEIIIRRIVYIVLSSLWNHSVPFWFLSLVLSFGTVIPTGQLLRTKAQRFTPDVSVTKLTCAIWDQEPGLLARSARLLPTLGSITQSKGTLASKNEITSHL